jgi:alpha,alpha-trehalose phosphorylase
MIDWVTSIVRDNRKEIDELLVDETIFSSANGILGVKGTFTEGYGIESLDGKAMLNGLYNTFPYKYEENSIHFPQHGQTIIQLPDASNILIKANDELIDLTHAKLTHLSREYNLREGITYRSARYRTPKDFEFEIHETKFTSFTTKDLAISKISITSINFEGQIKLTSSIKMPHVSKEKSNDPRVAQNKKHLQFENGKANESFGILSVQTKETGFWVHVGITHNLPFNYNIVGDRITATYQQTIKPNSTLDVIKYQIYQGSHLDIYDDIEQTLNSIETFEYYKAQQLSYYEQFWLSQNTKVDDLKIHQALQYCVFQLNSSGGEHENLQIAAKGLSGLGYEGHYFWDTEIYMIPYFVLTNPSKAKKLLLYRYHNLDKAKSEAYKLGVKQGAKIPWRTINGTEASPYYPAGSAQIHINSDLAFAIMQYFNATNDVEFMENHGLEMLIETAKFLLAYGHYKNGQFHLDGVTGPDEYTAIVNDNYYTNQMAKTHFESIISMSKRYQSSFLKAIKKCSVGSDFLDELNKAAQSMTRLVDTKLNVVKQDSTFLDKQDIDLNIFPSDKHPLLLHYHPLFIYRHQLLKQADAILAMVLLQNETRDIFDNSYHYYLSRTTHDSSLSKCIYGIAAYQLNQHDLAYEFYLDVVGIDLNNTKKHTQHGLHMANMGGAYLMMIYGLFNIKLNTVLTLSPIKQETIQRIETTIKYQGCTINLALDTQRLKITVDKPIEMLIYEDLVLVSSFKEVLLKHA